MTSPLPPKRRDSRNLADLIRQDRTNLRQLDRGLVGGRFPNARPLKPHGLGDGDEEDDEVADVLFDDTDTFTATAAGDQTFTLSFLPAEGSVHMAWGGLWQPHTEFRVDYETGVVNIPDTPNGSIKAGHVFDFRYAHYGDTYVPEPLTGFTLRGVFEGHPTSPLPLPSGTQVGDTIIFIVMNAYGTATTTTDTRLTKVADLPNPSWSGVTSGEVWIGKATDLSNIAATASVANPMCVVVTLVEHTAVTAHASASAFGAGTLALPTVAQDAVLLVSTVNNSTVPGGAPVTSATGYALIAKDTGPSGFQMWSVFGFIGSSPSPSGSIAIVSGDAAAGFLSVAIGVTST